MTHGYSYAKAMFCFNLKSKSHNSVHKHFLDIEVSFPSTCSINHGRNHILSLILSMQAQKDIGTNQKTL